MRIPNLFDSMKLWRSRTPVQASGREMAPRRATVSRLAVESLEDRCVPAVVVQAL